MKFGEKQKPTPAPHIEGNAFSSVAAIGSALVTLVDRMETEVAKQGIIAEESARELRALRVGAEYFLEGKPRRRL